MTSDLCRRSSMSLLSIYDLETFHEQIQTKLQNNKKTVLEDLPNEILIDIFSFLSTYDLHRGLGNLNYRLNSIYQTQKISLDLSSTRRVFTYFCVNQQPFLSQTYSLKLDDSYGRLRIFDQYMNINRFTNLRKLTIREPSVENLDQILSKVHELPYLSYLNIKWAFYPSNIMRKIFQIRRLKYLILSSMELISFYLDNNHIQPLTELEYVELNGCYMSELFKLLEYIGTNVRTIKTSIRFDRQLDIKTMINQILVNQTMPTSIRRIEISFYYISLADFHLFLRLFPNLTHLTFSTLTNNINFICSSIWCEFLSENLLQLKQLQFYIQIKGLSGHVIQCPSTEFIDTFYTMNNQWLIGSLVMDYNSLLTAPLLEIYTYPQSRVIRKNPRQLYGVQRYILPRSTASTINVDEHIADLSITLTNNNEATSIYETNMIYPKVTSITIDSTMIRTFVENYRKISLIISDIIKSIPDLSKITSIHFVSSSTVYPSATLARRLLDKIPKISRLELSYGCLLYLLRSPLIVIILSKKIGTLSIIYDTDPPILPDMIRILKIFSKNLRFLYLNIRTNIPAKKFYFILPLLFSGICEKLYGFRLISSRRILNTGPSFDDELKLRFQNCLDAQMKRDKTKYDTMEYKIKDNELAISF